MKRKDCVLLLLIVSLLSLTGCYSMTKSVMTKRLKYSYDYVYIEMPSELLSGISSVNPAEIISEAYAKKGFKIIPELSEDLLKKTLVVKYTESNRRDLEDGRMIDCTIDVSSAYDDNHFFTCPVTDQTIKGPDDLRVAVKKALSYVI